MQASVAQPCMIDHENEVSRRLGERQQSGSREAWVWVTQSVRGQLAWPVDHPSSDEAGETGTAVVGAAVLYLYSCTCHVALCTQIQPAFALPTIQAIGM